MSLSFSTIWSWRRSDKENFDKNLIEESFDQSQEKSSRSKFKSTLDVFKREKNAKHYPQIRKAALQWTIKFPQTKGHDRFCLKLFEVVEVIIWDKELFYTIK